MTDQDEVMARLIERGAVLKGHFQLASGRHADTYIEKFRILQWPDLTKPFCAQIANQFRGLPNLVVGPTTGGVILSYEVAAQLGLRGIIAEKVEGAEQGEVLRREYVRGFEIGAEDQVLVVDDVLTTGGSIRDSIAAAEARGAKVVAVGVLVDRSGGKIDFGVPFFACMTIDVASWAPADCQLCRDGVPLTVT